MTTAISKSFWVTQDSGLAVRQYKPLRVAVRPQHLLQAILSPDGISPVHGRIQRRWPSWLVYLLMAGS